MTELSQKKIGRVAYLAPEIPALSATFVYNEILALEKLGFVVVPISVHEPNAVVADNAAIKQLAQRTHYLYQNSLAQFIFTSARSFLRRPIVFLRTMGNMTFDVVSVGPFTHTGIGLVYRFLAAANVAELLRKERCTHLHIHFAHIPTDIGMYAAALAGIPYSFTSHANDIFQQGWLLKKKVSRAQFCVTISKYNKHFLKQHGVQEESIHVVHCGVDIRAFSTLTSKVDNEKLVIGTLGRAIEKKGFDILLTTVAILKQKGITLQLILAGDGPLLPKLKHDAARLGIAADVVFCGSIAHNKVSEWLQQLDMFVLPCKQDSNGDMDGIPVVLMEAMMVGTPVVSTRLSGIPELVIDNSTGMIAQPSDPVSLSHAILTLQSDEALRQRLIKAAVKMVEEQYDLSKNTKYLAKLILGTVK